ncbi:nucleoside triphosphate pyrophosphohydrolase [Shouchella clausii]|uniref:nucleoside triphosphate pyrophosphohydrolase n=1 Tax=Shouchella clausii TaxID=79880 RepID=UPI000BA74895|nr:nucleoside triphosphate pyrophosphohydrolase [Shouchella clausii]PAF07697.1 nucleoside triphosphate pyrophosphohydrolase [Shouchella clausii]
MGTISVVGLGAGNLAQLPLGIYRALKKANRIYVRTDNHPVLVELAEEGLAFTSFDSVYEQHSEFEDVYKEITTRLLEEAKQGDVLYAVPGHPFVAERTIQLLQKQAQGTSVTIDVLGGASFLDNMYTALAIDPIEGCQIVDGTALRAEELQIRHHLIIVQVYDALIASEVKLTLMEKLPDDYEVSIVTAAGTPEQSILRVPLFELDHYVKANNLTAVYVPPVREDRLLHRDFSYLRGVIATLRGPEGCPWDQKQTHHTLKRYLLEEAFEVFEAIDEEDDSHLAEELGDVLLQVLLHAQIGEEQGYFNVDDVIGTLTEKMIRRHPHVFGGAKAETAGEVLQTWQQIKAQEQAEQPKPKSALDGLAATNSMLVDAAALQERAAKTGFEWANVEEVWEKLFEEIEEFKVEAAKSSKSKMEKEYGDILLAAVSLARFYDLSPEIALHRSLTTFKKRFLYVEQKAQEKGQAIADIEMSELDRWWNEAKGKFNE